ncbi:MAG: DUF2808 domain-containing protein [Cyanomargarita calcarea GSE-NOS-MK-12-04C]|jgi:hypothetical protein|uniref:DUF2808 domain-containing protein n=1 Tax=Cyanomargarita calcarea GSE-NOS-MK-12-04C TaxID=2839659 RepID=A0A951QKD1_9CYAN|nr:DUF2808 domain-containing protein [Cyanomargarita calcarea GSE-NOS-MK-12-04C]
MKFFPQLPLKLIAATIIFTSADPIIFPQPVIASEIKKVAAENGDYLRLISVHTNESTVGTRNTRYTFTINVPKSSQPLKRISITQRGGLELIKFKGRKVKAYGSSKDQQKIQISQIDIDSKTQGLTATFDPLVQPGQILKIVLLVNENPLSDGNYFFNVVVYSQGKYETVVSLGTGRLRITSIR